MQNDFLLRSTGQKGWGDSEWSNPAPTTTSARWVGSVSSAARHEDSMYLDVWRRGHCTPAVCCPETCNSDVVMGNIRKTTENVVLVSI